MLRKALIFVLLLTAQATLAGSEAFQKGPVFKNYGENAVVPGGLANPESQTFKVVFDISESQEPGELNRNFNSVARFINMHARAGVPLDNMKVAVVVHGKASQDLMSNQAYQERFSKDNANEQLLNALLRSGVEIYICGQSAAFAGISEKQLNPDVAMSLSAMTANALLQQRGFSLNPF